MGVVWRRGKFTLFMLFIQVLFIVLFAVFVKYDKVANAKYDMSLVKDVKAYKEKHSAGHKEEEGHGDSAVTMADYYGMFQDVHVMIFIGFGFLMTFLKRYGFTSVTMNMLLASFCIQWSMLVHGFFHLHNGYIELNILSMLLSDFSAACVLITFGAMIGKLSPIQFVVMAMFEIPIFTVNEYIGLEIFRAVDVGGSMFVHVFGALFGLMLSRVMYTSAIEDQNHKEAATYNQDLFSMIGTIFLWMFWPSFNAALAPGDDKMRAVLNTYLALTSCSIIAMCVSAVLNKEDKFDMEHIQNATLAGGVAIGTTADFMVQPWGALTVGAVAGVLSVFGFKFIPPLESRLKFHDTCGVINLHGLPGIMAGLGGAVGAYLASYDDYGPSLYQIFPARVPVANSTAYINLHEELNVEPGLGRSAGEQASYQLAALALTIGMSMLGGAITGFILRIPMFNQPKNHEIFDDVPWFEIPYGYPPEYNTPEEERKAKLAISAANGHDNRGADIEFTKV